ncbi:cytochrome P450 [soil metagenome]
MEILGRNDAIGANELRASEDLSPVAEAPDRAFEFCRSPQRFLLDLALAEGPVAKFRVGAESFAVLSSPEVIHAVLAGSLEGFEKGPLYDLARTAFGDGLFTADGQDWADQQIDLAPLFTRRRISQLAGTAAELIDRQLESWEKLPDGDTIDILAATKRLAFDVLRTGVLGISNPILSDELFDALDRIANVESVRLHYLAKRIPGIAGPFLKTPLFDRLDEVLYAIVDEELAGAGGSDDLIGVTIRSPKFLERALEGQRKFLRDQIASMLTAGFVSTGESMFWALYLLARHPEAQARVQAEVRSGGEAGQDPADRPLPYLAAVLNESLRLYPPAWFIGRVARRDVRLGTVEISAGTRLICSPYILHRMPALWPDPEAFQPERFLPGSAIVPRSFIPFSVGPRGCIGRSIAMMEIPALVGAVLSRFDVQIESTQPAELAAAFTMHPRERVLFRLQRR